MFADVTSSEGSETDREFTPYADSRTIPSDGGDDALELQLTREMEDALLRDSTGGFASWVASFIRRVIQLLENLPEEVAHGSAGGTTEGILTLHMSIFVDITLNFS